MNYHVIDKTMLIKDLPDQHDRVTLITRSRRFGKTFNLSMLSEFFDRQ
ncbi:MAG: AAA family ATPase [Bulleidia sp.]